MTKPTNDQQQYILHAPGAEDWRLPFSIGTRSIAALEGAERAYKGAGGSLGEHRGSIGVSQARSLLQVPAMSGGRHKGA